MNDTTKKFNLYEEDVREVSSNPAEEFGNMVSDSIMVYVDLTKPLPELIKPIRETLQDKPEGFQLDLYLVCGLNCNQDTELFVAYLNTVLVDFKLRFFVRGIIHPEFISILLLDDVWVENNLKLIYRQNSLHTLMKNLMLKPEVFRRFVQRFIDQYSNFPSEVLLDTTELDLMGFNLNKF